MCRLSGGDLVGCQMMCFRDGDIFKGQMRYPQGNGFHRIPDGGFQPLQELITESSPVHQRGHYTIRKFLHSELEGCILAASSLKPHGIIGIIYIIFSELASLQLEELDRSGRNRKAMNPVAVLTGIP